jgi:hypothetical protein
VGRGLAAADESVAAVKARAAASAEKRVVVMAFLDLLGAGPAYPAPSCPA